MSSSGAKNRIELFLSRFPQLYHVSLCKRPSDILDNGFSSAAELIRRFGCADSESPLCSQRKQPVEIAAPWGSVTLNDQKPLPRAGLLRCLEGLSPEDWYAELNERIFFFPHRKAAERFASVRTSAMPERTIFAVDSRELYELGGARLELSAINTGNAMRRPAKRSRATFQPIEEYPLELSIRSRGWRRAVAEVSVRSAHLHLRSLAQLVG